MIKTKMLRVNKKKIAMVLPRDWKCVFFCLKQQPFLAKLLGLDNTLDAQNALGAATGSRVLDLQSDGDIRLFIILGVKKTKNVNNRVSIKPFCTQSTGKLEKKILTFFMYWNSIGKK